MKKLMTVVLAALSAAVTYGGYTQLSYLKATGKQWIHTGYTPADTDRIETRVRFANVDSFNLFVWCTRGSNGSDSYTCMFFKDGSKGGYFQVKHGNTGASQSTSSSIISSGEDAVIVANGVTGECSCNYTKQFTVSTTSFPPAGPIALFAKHELGSALRPDSTGVSDFVSGRIYYFRVYDAQGNLVRDFIPVRNDSAAEGSINRYGLLETVTGSFHPSCGSAAFEPGPDAGPEPHRMQRVLEVGQVESLGNDQFQAQLTFANPGYPQRLFMAYGNNDGGDTTNGWEQVEALAEVGAFETSRTVLLPSGTKYVRFFVQPAIPGAKMLASISSSGTDEYVNIAYKTAHASSVECRFNLLRTTVGTGQAAACPFGSRTSPGSDQMCATFADTWYLRYGNNSVSGPSVVSGEYHFLFDREYYSVNGTLYTLPKDDTFVTVNDIVVFAFNDKGTQKWFTKMDFYSLAFWNDGVLERSYVPCRKDDGTPALYDAVNGGFYVNEGTTPLSCGAEVWSVSQIVSVSPTTPVAAEWTGLGATDEFANPTNWVCRNVLGEVLTDALPAELTEVVVNGSTKFSWPEGRTLTCKSIAFDCTLANDADWCGLDVSLVVPGAKIKLEGCTLTIADLGFDGMITGMDDLAEPVVSELQVVVPQNVTTINSAVLLDGALKLVKKGKGTLKAAKAVQSYTGGTVVEAGTLQAGVDNENAAFGTGVIEILPDGIFDTNACSDQSRLRFVLKGGTMANTGKAVSATKQSLGSVTLLQDSQWRPVGGGLGGICQLADDPPFNLNGFTLDVSAGDALQFLGPCVVTNGTIVDRSGFTTYGGYVDASTVDLELFSFMTLYVSVGVRDLTLNKDVYVAASTGTIGVNGIFTPRSNKFPNVRLQDGSTLNLAEVDGAWSVDSDHPGFKTSIAPDATVTIDLGERNLHSGDRIVKWAAKPGELRSSQIKLKAKWKAFRVTVEDNGLYLRSGLVILVK